MKEERNKDGLWQKISKCFRKSESKEVEKLGMTYQEFNESLLPVGEEPFESQEEFEETLMDWGAQCSYMILNNPLYKDD
jgi:hypothetical protein